MYLFFLYLALTLFFLLALTRSTSALTLLAGLLPTYLLRFTILGIPTNFFEATVWLAVLAILLHSPKLLVTSYWSLTPKYWLLVTLFITAATLSTLLTPTTHSFGILKSWVITPIVFGLLISTLSSSEERDGLPAGQVGVRWMNPLIVSGVTVSLLGLFQLGSLDRITSIYDVPNSLALFLAPLIILAFFRRSFLNYLAAFIMFAALLATQSLAGLAAVLLTLLAALVRSRGLRFTVYGLSATAADPPPWRAGYWLLVTLIIFSIATLTITGRLSYFFQPRYNPAIHTSVTVRQQLWGISWELIKEHPLAGIGLGQFEPAYQKKLHERFQKFSPPSGYGLRVTGPLSEFVFRDPHNWILSFWLNTGLLGLLSFAALNLLALKPLLFTSRVTSYWLQAPALALLTLLLFGLVDTIYWKNDLAALHWLLLFTVLSSAPVSPKQTASQ